MWKVLEQGTDENGPFGHGLDLFGDPICGGGGMSPNLKP